MGMTDYEINFLLFGTTSIFHNNGLSIYLLNENLTDRHSMTMIKRQSELVSLDYVEPKLQRLPEATSKFIFSLLDDAANTAKKYVKSIARSGVLFSHEHLMHQMKPHIHRQVYSTEILPCLTVHYRITGSNIAIFNYWDSVSQDDAMQNDLCRRDTIVDWCSRRPFKTLELINDKNVILFNSGLVPHSVTHTADFNAYFIFDNVKLIDPRLVKSNVPVIL